MTLSSFFLLNEKQLFVGYNLPSGVKQLHFHFPGGTCCCTASVILHQMSRTSYKHYLPGAAILRMWRGYPYLMILQVWTFYHSPSIDRPFSL